MYVPVAFISDKQKNIFVTPRHQNGFDIAPVKIAIVKFIFGAFWNSIFNRFSNWFVISFTILSQLVCFPVAFTLKLK